MNPATIDLALDTFGEQRVQTRHIALPGIHRDTAERTAVVRHVVDGERQRKSDPADCGPPSRIPPDRREIFVLAARFTGILDENLPTMQYINCSTLDPHLARFLVS
ncbi:hypothetical protein XU06_29585 (plasmid) [Rhodococcus erythropolis]|nr:hypothetical protein XU06_29585 [Rhodococcus erythropolis]